MKILSTQELEQILQTRHGILPDICVRLTDGQHLRLDTDAPVPGGYAQTSVLGIFLHLADLKGLLRPCIDVRHGDPIRAAQQIVDAIRQ